MRYVAVIIEPATREQVEPSATRETNLNRKPPGPVFCPHPNRQLLSKQVGEGDTALCNVK